MKENGKKFVTLSGYTAGSKWCLSFNITEVVSPKTSKAQMRKILTFIQRNRFNTALEICDEYDDMIQTELNSAHNRLYELYRAACLAYQNGYVDAEFRGRTPKEVKQFETENKRLFNAALRAKNQYERYKDRFSVWESIKEKYPM